MITTKRRLDRLEQSAKMKRGREPTIILVGCAGRDDAAVVGIKAVGMRLPAVTRLPGETVDAMKARAAARVTGPGPLLAFASYGELC